MSDRGLSNGKEPQILAVDGHGSTRQVQAKARTARGIGAGACRMAVRTARSRPGIQIPGAAVKERFTLLHQHRAEPTDHFRRRFMLLTQILVENIRNLRRDRVDATPPGEASG